MTLLKLSTAHENLVRTAINGRLTEDEALAWMVLLHTHEIQLHPGAVADADGVLVVFAPLTQRDAAGVIADVWAEVQGGQDERSRYAYWYRQYNSETPYEVLDDVPGALRPRLSELRDALARDPRVAAVVAED